MRKTKFTGTVLLITAFCILVPLLLLILWSFTERWPWPLLLPESYSLRTIKELLFGSASLPELLISSILLASIVALLSTIIGIMTARATEFYEFKGKSLVRFGTFLPLIVPGTVLAMGLQIVFLRLGIADTLLGVVLIHVIVSLPYCITIMTDVTRALGKKYEEQAAVLGAGPFRAFFEVTLPNMLPGFLSSMSMGFILSYSQYFTTLIIGGGRIKTLALVLVPYIQSGDRPLMAVYSVAFVASALLIFFVFEWLIKNNQQDGNK